MTGNTNYTGITNGDDMLGPAQITAVYEHFDPLVGESVSTSSSLPTSNRWAGRTVYVADTGITYVWSGSAWKYVTRPRVALIKDITQTSVLATQSKVTWSTSAASVDVGGFYSTSNNTRLTVPVTGVYSIKTTVAAQDSTSTRKIGVLKNGTWIQYIGANANTSVYAQTPTGFTVLPLNAGDYIEISAVDSVNLSIVVAATTVYMELIS